MRSSPRTWPSIRRSRLRWVSLVSTYPGARWRASPVSLMAPPMVGSIYPPRVRRPARPATSGPPEKSDGTVVVMPDGQGVGQALGAAPEALGDECLGLPHESVDADVDVRAGHLDEAVGIEHQSIAGSEYAVLVDVG